MTSAEAGAVLFWIVGLVSMRQRASLVWSRGMLWNDWRCAEFRVKQQMRAQCHRRRASPREDVGLEMEKEKESIVFSINMSKMARSVAE
jgi:hypothetical protein